MKRKNFPGRVNKRRIEAVERMKQAPTANAKAIENTEAKIVSQSVAYGTKTKKYRG